MAQYGYEFGNPFGDPSKFTRSTGEDEVDRYNQWMRGQDWWKNANGDPNKIQQGLTSAGIAMPKDFHLDEAGNFNQKSRAKKIALISAAIGGGVLTAGLAGPAIAGALGGGSAAAGGGAGAGIASGVGAGTLASTATAPLAAGVLSSAVPTAVGSSLAAGTIAGGGLAAGGGMGLSSLAGGIGKKVGGDILGRIGAGMAGGAQASANNRGQALEAAQVQDRNNIARAAEERAQRAELFRKMMQADYVGNYQPSGVSFSPYSRPIQSPSDAAKAAAMGLRTDVMGRMAQPNYGMMPPPNVNQYTKPSIWERIAGIAAPTLATVSR